MRQLEEERGTSARPAARWPSLRRLIPAGILVVGLIVYFAFDLNRFITLDSLRDNREMLKAWVDHYGVMSGVIYAAAYALAVALSIPGAVVLTIFGGFLFGPYAATVYVVFGATIGATAVFLAARYAFSDLLRARAGGALQKMEAGFNQSPFSYMLILRLVPLFPFWLVNLVPAFLGVRLWTFVVSTFFGIIPGCFVYTLVGAGADALLDAGEDLDLWIILEFRFLAPIIGLIVLAAIPVVYKKVRERRKDIP